MNRIERRDGRLDFHLDCEPNYSVIDFFFEENRRNAFRRWLWKGFWTAVAAVACGWLIHHVSGHWMFPLKWWGGGR